jgi:hypothetical protein
MGKDYEYLIHVCKKYNNYYLSTTKIKNRNKLGIKKQNKGEDLNPICNTTLPSPLFIFLLLRVCLIQLRGGEVRDFNVGKEREKNILIKYMFGLKDEEGRGEF